MLCKRKGYQFAGKGYVPLAEWNKISRKCFSHTSLPRVIGDLKVGSCFCCVRHYWPSHPPILRIQFVVWMYSTNLVFLLVFPFLLLVSCNSFMVWFYNKSQAAAVGLPWLPVVCEKLRYFFYVWNCFENKVLVI